MEKKNLEFNENYEDIYELYKKFQVHLYNPADKKIVKYIKQNDPELRLQIHRDNIFIALEFVLNDVFANTRNYIGHNEFEKLAVEFVKKYKSYNANIDMYLAEELPNYLDGDAKILAEFEVCLNKATVYLANNNWDISNFTKLDENNMANVSFNLHKSVFIYKTKSNIINNNFDSMELEAAIPVEITKYNNDLKNQINANEEYYYLISGARAIVNIFQINSLEYMFLELLLQSYNLSDIYNELVTKYKAFDDLGLVLERFLPLQIIASMNLI